MADKKRDRKLPGSLAEFVENAETSVVTGGVSAKQVDDFAATVRHFAAMFDGESIDQIVTAIGKATTGVRPWPAPQLFAGVTALARIDDADAAAACGAYRLAFAHHTVGGRDDGGKAGAGNARAVARMTIIERYGEKAVAAANKPHASDPAVADWAAPEKGTEAAFARAVVSALA